MLDMNQPQELLAQLQTAAQPRPIDPAFPLQLARVKRDMDRSFGEADTNLDLFGGGSSDLVHTCLSSVARWLTNYGI